MFFLSFLLVRILVFWHFFFFPPSRRRRSSLTSTRLNSTARQCFVQPGSAHDLYCLRQEAAKELKNKNNNNNRIIEPKRKGKKGVLSLSLRRLKLPGRRSRLGHVETDQTRRLDWRAGRSARGSDSGVHRIWRIYLLLGRLGM